MRAHATICTVDSCGRKIAVKPYCFMHFRRWKKHGDPLRGARPTQDPLKYRMLRTAEGKCVTEHIVIAERALGRPLPKGAQVHHVNENKLDNRPSNLVICPSAAYHNMLHMRTRAYDACGHADWRLCYWCKQYDKPENLRLISPSKGGLHPACQKEKNRRYKGDITIAKAHCEAHALGAGA